ncbi:hypothetical protein LTR78_007756 [Recurvomyces mirabilis]|uniref:Uncharacterized protein n=1 Tax=Recurvomyces mirabilis TaxID=574656 RepID=A0AAE0TSC4_9PEZI|nr:hypothetical protein LTR78_007756 [Recurvomyces mirabilis]KAK5151644.1 hypothetical protein LTS14_009131 [Recurvomyces mirabilis]
MATDTSTPAVISPINTLSSAKSGLTVTTSSVPVTTSVGLQVPGTDETSQANGTSQTSTYTSSSIDTGARSSKPSGMTGDEATSVSIVGITSSAASLSSSSAIADSTSTAASAFTTGISATPHPHSSISVGGLAGAIIGAAILASILTFLITFCCMRRDIHRKEHTQAKSRRRSRRSSHTTAAGGAGEKALVSGTSWERHLPQVADDRQVHMAVKTIFDQLQAHVENFYAPIDSQIPQDVADHLSAIQTPFLQGSVTSVLATSRYQLTVMKHCLSYLVAANLTTGGEDSILPNAYTALELDETRTKDNSNQVVAQREAYSKWRILTAHLHAQSAATTEEIAQKDQRISIMVKSFSDAVHFWLRKSEESAAAREHLTQIIRQAAPAAAMIFAQPSAYAYSWAVVMSRIKNERGLVVSPALEKVADGDGHALRQAQTIVAAITEPL